MDWKRTWTTAALATLLATAICAPCAAAEGHVETEADGTVVASIELDLPLARVRIALDYEVLHPTASPDVVRVEVLRQRGRCDEVASTVRGGPLELDYTALRCPTADGWQVDLLESDDMTALSVQWQVVEQGTATRLTFRIRSSTNMPVPVAVQQRLLRRTALETVQRFERTVTAG